jgi:hypothetical protein
MNKNPHKSVSDLYIFVDPHKSVQNPHKSVSTSYPHKSVDTYVYFIEGHVPIEAIEKLLTEKLEIDGIALPQMPSGSPGMTKFKLFPFKIHSIKNVQDQGIFM